MQADFERYGVAARMNLGGKSEDTRKRIAALINATADEIAFTRNATDGINLVLAGLDWQPGDEIISTDEEHPAMSHPLLYLQRTRGVRVHWLDISPDPAVMLARLDAVVSPRTRLVGMSHVPCETGTRLPARDICAWAAARDILTLFDGAQAFGAFRVDMRDLGCDFYTTNGHKWGCGPKGTGVFYARKDRLTSLSPAHVGAGSLEKADMAKRRRRAVGHRRSFRVRHALVGGLRRAGRHPRLVRRAGLGQRRAAHPRRSATISRSTSWSARTWSCARPNRSTRPPA